MIHILKDLWIRIRDYNEIVDTCSDLYEDITLLQEEIETLKKLNTLKDVNDAKYWNEKWKQSNVYYSAPNRKLVTSYLEKGNYSSVVRIARDIINDFGLSIDDVDMVPLAVMKWNKAQKWKYKPDKGEKWNTPSETLTNLAEGKYCDCDDLGVLEYYLIREIFIQLNVWEKVKHRLKAMAGNVNRRGNIPSSAGGHFYLNWLTEDCEWMTIESTYYLYMAIANWKKKAQKLNPMYGTIWFSFNEEYSWAQNSLTVSKKDFEKEE